MNAEGRSFEPTILYPANNNQFPEWRSRRSISQLFRTQLFSFPTFRADCCQSLPLAHCCVCWRSRLWKWLWALWADIALYLRHRVFASLRRGGCHYVLFRHLALATSTGLNYECTDAPTDTRRIANLLQNETRQQMTLSEFVSKFARHCGIAGWAGGWAVALWASACEHWACASVADGPKFTFVLEAWSLKLISWIVRGLGSEDAMWWEIIPSAAVIGTVFWIVPTLSEQVAKALYNTVSSAFTQG